MNQFKDVFLGTGKRDYTRAVDTQKCIRVSGKHNDLEEVGRDTYHHTFFEMLGNWSFGDYFKEEAIPWAWELLTRCGSCRRSACGSPSSLATRRTACRPTRRPCEHLAESTDIDPAHILRFGRKDNFWEMGETGPCGPAREIHIDRGGPGSDPRDGADPKIGVNAGNERFIELWNNVFMQFNRLDDGRLVRAAGAERRHGHGLRARALRAAGQALELRHRPVHADLRAHRRADLQRYQGGTSEADVAFRVCADHMRAVSSSAFADGALPSQRGPRLRAAPPDPPRLALRRARRSGREDPFLCAARGSAVARALGDAFPEIPRRADHCSVSCARRKRPSARRSIAGLVLFGDVATKLERSGQTALPGSEAFELYATYGFPQDLVELMARERGLAVDLAGWQAAEEAHRAARARRAASSSSCRPSSSLDCLRRSPPITRRTARALESPTRVVRFIAGEGGEDRLVLEQSPFYPEGGGQIGDQGVVEAADGSFRFHVSDTQKLGDVVVHVGRSEGIVRVGSEAVARVDMERRAATRANHTATHLLHQALRAVLGEHVTQQGSYVGPDRLRFDLSHPRAITQRGERAHRAARERARSRQRTRSPPRSRSLERAKARGVMALFGEKYGDRVRVVDVGGWSMELCGGTHVRAAGDIGPFVIVSERAIQAGVRRIEALTGHGALAWMREQRRLLVEAAQALKVKPEEVPERIEAHAEADSRGEEAREGELERGSRDRPRGGQGGPGATRRDPLGSVRPRGARHASAAGSR